MRVTNVIIITSGMSDIATHQALETLLRDLLNANKKPILVLGPDGDDFLLNVRGVEDCELVFDPNFDGGLFSGIKAGVLATHGASLVIPLRSARPGTVERCLRFEASIMGDGSTLECDLANPHSNEFFIVTAKGLNHLRKLPASSAWPNPELTTMSNSGPEPTL